MGVTMAPTPIRMVPWPNLVQAAYGQSLSYGDIFTGRVASPLKIYPLVCVLGVYCYTHLYL